MKHLNSKTFFTCLLSFILVISCLSLVACGDNSNSSQSPKSENSSSQKQEIPKSENSSKKASPSEESKSIGSITKTKVTKIYDGDTFYVDAYKMRIRIIGVDCPEAGTSAGETATAYTKSIIPPGTTVWLETDVSDVDMYDRPLRYVWLSEPPSNVTKSDVEKSTLQGRLLTSGNAKAKTYRPDVKYADWFSQL
ncbi:MAG: thermonuclease family protein [Coriobacteriales bacterium]|nr:thermonuclease family protein [Coriobacteriales bacterium]